MGQDELIKVLKDAPFRPFRIHLSDGRALEVRHPELVLVSRRSAHVFFPSARRPPTMTIRLWRCDKSRPWSRWIRLQAPRAIRRVVAQPMHRQRNAPRAQSKHIREDIPRVRYPEPRLATVVSETAMQFANVVSVPVSSRTLTLADCRASF